MNKTMRIGTLPTHGGGRVSVYIKVETIRGYLSISGVIGPSRAGNAYGGCGQIDMEFEHRNPEHNDKRYSEYLTMADDFNFALGWNKERWFDLLEVWHEYHLKKEYPQSAIDLIEALPDSDREPAWV